LRCIMPTLIDTFSVHRADRLARCCSNALQRLR
jgi:hypothetical protein